MKRSFETGQSQVAIVNAALEYYFAHVAPESTEPLPPDFGDGEAEKGESPDEN